MEEDFALAEKDTLYRCLDRIRGHRTELFRHLRRKWEDLSKVKFDVLLYGLTSTCFESDSPLGEDDQRQFGYSRDKHPDCVPVVIALVVTLEGFPPACEVMAGNTSDKTTWRDCLKKMEDVPGKAGRIGVMVRGLPGAVVLAEMRASDTRPPPDPRAGGPWVRGGRARSTRLQTKDAISASWPTNPRPAPGPANPRPMKLSAFARTLLFAFEILTTSGRKIHCEIRRGKLVFQRTNSPVLRSPCLESVENGVMLFPTGARVRNCKKFSTSESP